MEIAPIPERKAELKRFIEATIARCGVEVDGHFGFRGDGLPLEEQRTAGFGLGRFITGDEGISRRVLAGTATVPRGSGR